MTDSEILALASQQSVSPRLVFREQLPLAALYEMQRHTEFHSFVFQGGTALRLCYNNPRFSEDLDFVVRSSPPARISLDEPLPWENIVDALTEVFPGANGFKVRVQKADSGIQRSIITCQTPYERGLHRLHLECVRVPAHTTAESIIQAPQGRFTIVVETPKEILADKLVAVGLRSYFKGRDMWDIAFLQHQKVSVDLTLIQTKLRDYGHSATDYLHKLDQQRIAMQTPDSILNLRMELARFLTREQIERFDAEGGWKRMLDGTLNLITSIQHSIAPAPPTQRGPHL